MRGWTRRLAAVSAAVMVVAGVLVALAWKSDIPLDQLKARWATGASHSWTSTA